jgi:membrane protein
MDASREAAREERRPYGVLSEDPDDLLHGRGWRVARGVLREAVLRLWDDDAMGLAGNIAFRVLLAAFPFLIFVTSLAAFLVDRAMADGLVTFLIAIVPGPLIEPLVAEITNVLTVQRGGILSVGVLLTIWFALGGVDGVRVGLNRAYDIRECRATVVIYALEVLMVILLGLMLVLVGYMLVLAPLAGSALHRLIPSFEPDSAAVGLAIRYPVSVALLAAGLFAAHVFLPARRTRFSSIWPGVLFTIVAWGILASAFSWYISRFANYASYYAGLAGIIAGIYFIYLAALLLIFGGELNRAIRIRRLATVLRRRH